MQCWRKHTSTPNSLHRALKACGQPTPPASPPGTATLRPGRRPRGLPTAQDAAGTGSGSRSAPARVAGRPAAPPPRGSLAAPASSRPTPQAAALPLPGTGASGAGSASSPPRPRRGSPGRRGSRAPQGPRRRRGSRAAPPGRHAGLQPERGEDLQSQLRQVPSRGEYPGPPRGAAPSARLRACGGWALIGPTRGGPGAGDGACRELSAPVDED